jgi:hypothetical protein
MCEAVHSCSLSAARARAGALGADITVGDSEALPSVHRIWDGTLEGSDSKDC